MDTRFGLRNLGQAILTLIGIAVFAYSTTGDYFNLPSLGNLKPYGIIFALLLFFGGILWHFMDLQIALSDRRPLIRLNNPPLILDDVSMEMTMQDSKGIFHVSGVSLMAHGVFANNPRIRTEQNNSIGVRAEITFLDRYRKPLFTMQGRWSQSDQPSEIKKGKLNSIESTDFPNNGALRTLDLFMKYPEDLYCFGYNNDSYNYPFYQNPKNEIRDNRFFVQIQLKGSYIPNRYWEFEVETMGKGDTFSIKQNQHWTKLESTQAQKITSKVKVPNISTTHSEDKNQINLKIPSWDGVQFLPWNPTESRGAKCGIEVINNKQESIVDCYAEVIEIYEIQNGQYSPCYINNKGELPSILAWEFSHKSEYQKIEIEWNKHRYLGLTYSDWWVSGYTNYIIKGKNFAHSWSKTSYIIAEIEISGKMDSYPLEPKRLFVYMMRQNESFVVTEVSTNPPKTKEEEELSNPI